MTAKAYRHRQSGTAVRIALGTGLLVALWVAVDLARKGSPWIALLVSILITIPLVLCLVAFHALGTEVTGGHVRVWFGPGWIVREIPCSEIEGIAPVRNRWWMGWGIRWIGPGALLWNVSGLHAIELKLRSGRRFRIGTDDPDGLAAAIRRTLEERRPSVGGDTR